MDEGHQAVAAWQLRGGTAKEANIWPNIWGVAIAGGAIARLAIPSALPLASGRLADPTAWISGA